MLAVLSHIVKALEGNKYKPADCLVRHREMCYKGRRVKELTHPAESLSSVTLKAL